MTTERPFGSWVGVDWSDTTHEVCVVDDASGDVQARFTVRHSAAGLGELTGRLTEEFEVLGVCIERKNHPIVSALLDAGVSVYPVNPKIVKSWRDGWRVNPSKTDRIDSWALADGLRLSHRRLEPLRLQDPLIRELRVLVDDEMGLIETQTSLVNSLQAALKAYFPALLDWFSDWTSSTAIDFVLRFPTPQILARAQDRTIIGFLKQHRIGYTRPVWQERTSNRRASLEWKIDDATIAAKSMLAVTLATTLKSLQGSLRKHRSRIEALFAEHEDADLFRSLPGAGPKLAPRLLAYFGSDREQHEDSEGLLALSGTVPVTNQSGNTRKPLVVFRWACQKGFRQTMHHFAWQSVLRCDWARAHYDLAKERGKGHALALRIVASKWIPILFRMWQSRTRYDDQRHTERLISKGSPVGALLRQRQEAA